MKTTDFGDPVFAPYTLKEMNGVKIAIIGQAFPYTPIANPRYLVPDWSFGIQDENMSTYAVTGSKYGFSILWVFLILLPMAYLVQEMTVRLGAVTKRGQAEAIFDGFGPFWGWFSLIDLTIMNWLTLVTEYIGMTAAMSIFGIPPWITFLAVTAILFGVVVSGQYWTFEKLTLAFCAFNLVYIPAAFWAMDTPTAPPWSEVYKGLFFNGLDMRGFTPELIFIVLANIGTTITPWMLSFQQSAVVDKGLDIHDVKMGRMETFIGSFFTCLVAVFIIITTAAAFFYHNPPIVIEDAKQTADAIAPLLPGGQGEWARRLFAIGLFDAGFLGALCISLSSSWAVGEVYGWAHSLNKKVKEAPWFYAIYLFHAADVRGGRPDPQRPPDPDHHVRPGGGGHDPPHDAGLSDPPAQRQAADGRTCQHAPAEHHVLVDRHRDVCHLIAVGDRHAFPEPVQLILHEVEPWRKSIRT